MRLHENREEAETSASSEASRPDEKSLEEELSERAAVVHRLRNHVSIILGPLALKNFPQNVPIMNTMIVSISGQFPGSGSLCVQISANFNARKFRRVNALTSFLCLIFDWSILWIQLLSLIQQLHNTRI